MIKRMSIYEFRVGFIYPHIINNLECYEYGDIDKIIEKLFGGGKLDEEEIVLCQLGDRYYVKDGMLLFYSIKRFLSDDFRYNGRTFTDIYSDDVVGLENILKSTYIKIRIVEGNEDELLNIINSEKRIYDNILYKKMLSVEDNIEDPNMKWCIFETILLDGGLKPFVVKEFDSKIDAWNYAKENEEDVKNDNNIIVYKIGLLKKIGNKYELEEDCNAIKIYQIINILKEK